VGINPTPPEALEGIISEQKAMTDNIAQRLEMILGVSAGMWMNLQRAYDQAIKSE
jgi:addiction module HigA family antidote